ncbi:MAG: hypothetical protein BZY87_01235 [SAR202 cluster bacterium Io17-Chloro-G6]|nr:MAG: hypothetical protein BZY87_01235 [SAR202 cluster bacterium Io17-Chloro-G6]
MRVGQINEGPVLVGGDYKRACLFFDEVIPVIWPSGESEDETIADIEKYGEYRDAIDAPILKESLINSQWRGWVEGYGHLAIGRFVFLKMRRDYPEAANIWQLADLTLDFLKNEMPGVDQNYISIFFPDVDTLAMRVVVDPLKQTLSALEQQYANIDIYGHEGLEDTENSVDVMLSNLDLIQCDDLSWERISEIKKDSEAINELRELRRFLVREMTGFTKSHVEEELVKAIEKHKNAADKLGIKTLVSDLVVGRETMIYGGMLAAIGAVRGPEEILATAGAWSLAFAGTTISVLRGRSSLVQNSEVKYLVRLNNETR